MNEIEIYQTLFLDLIDEGATYQEAHLDAIAQTKQILELVTPGAIQ